MATAKEKETAAAAPVTTEPPAELEAEAQEFAAEVKAFVAETVGELLVPLAERIAALEALLAEVAGAQETAGLSPQTIADTVRDAMAEAIREGAGDWISWPVGRELHVLGARLDAVETGVGRAIGRPVSGAVADLAPGEAPFLPSERFGPKPGPAGEGPEVATGTS